MILFENIKLEDKGLGGKAWGLGILAQRGFPVPPGVVLEREPTGAEWSNVVAWWKEQGRPPLAIRSSAGAEDSAETSFAGQNRTFLNVVSEETLKSAIEECFASYDKENSKSYRKFFGKGTAGRMNVVIQRMIQPRFAGVFFSEDPISREGGWILEVIKGLGEDLVSGKVTPGRLRQNGSASDLPLGFTQELGIKIAEIGLSVRDSLGFPLDMEWAVDAEGKIFVLQARPITTRSLSEKKNYIDLEWRRLLREAAPQTAWDGQTFSEWNGLPSRLTFSLWRKAFSPHHAFGNALEELGYRGFVDDSWSEEDSLLERVFGRAYVNLERLSTIYYGDIPYRIEPRPRPHTVFDSSKLGLHSFLHFPAAAWSMLRVGWNLSTRRKYFYQRCLEQLALFKHRFVRPLNDTAQIKRAPTATLLQMIETEVEEFSVHSLHWPLVLVVLTEATTQSLHQLVASVLGNESADERIRSWLGRGLHTVTFEMQQEFTKACGSVESRVQFIAKYGHRGPGEMDLAQPRWFEIGNGAFSVNGEQGVRVWQDHAGEIETEIRALKSMKREMILEEWQLLKKFLEAREAWKMELLKPYAWMRLLINEMGQRRGLGLNVHWLTLSELLDEEEWSLTSALPRYQKLIEARKEEDRAYRNFALPDFLSFKILNDILSGKSATSDGTQDNGEPLSPGVAYGEVRFVADPLKEDLSAWPENVVLAAFTTDPGWTPLFAKAKAVVVERGGVLSHCAILSREMGLPAISGIFEIEKQLKNGDRIWVDGNHGRIVHDKN
jgi:phosphohistidine swiveling domain-containing protein